MLIFIVILIGAVFVLCSMIRNMLASVTLMLGQVVRRFCLLLVALVVSYVLLAGMFSNAVTSNQPTPTPATTPATHAASNATQPADPAYPSQPVARAES